MTNRIKIIDYFETLINEVDIRAETLLTKYVSVGERNVDVEKVNQLRGLFIETLENLKIHNLTFLDAHNFAQRDEDDDDETLFDKYCFLLDPHDMSSQWYEKDIIDKTFGYLIVLEDGALSKRKLALFREMIEKRTQNHTFYQQMATFNQIESNIFNEKLDKIFKHVMFKLGVFGKKEKNLIIQTTEKELFQVESVFFEGIFPLPKVKPDVVELFFKNPISISISEPNQFPHNIDVDCLINSLMWFESNLNVHQIDLSLINKNQISLNCLAQVKSLRKLSFYNYEHDALNSNCYQAENLKALQIVNRCKSDVRMSFENLISLEELAVESKYAEILDLGAINTNVNLNKLHLSNCRLTSIDCLQFNCMPNLTELDISQNPIERIVDSTFASLGNLTTLIMNRMNKLNSIGEYTFNGLISLRTLEISAEDRDRLISMHPKALVPLKNLIRLSAGRIESPDVQLTHLIYLKHLELSSFSCDIPFDSIKTLQSLEDLDLYRIKTTVDDLSVFTRLKYVKLNRTRVDLFEGRDSFKGMSTLKRINIVSCYFTRVNSHTFDDLHNLTILQLSRNGIGIIEPGAFDHLHDLKTLNLSYNNLTSIGAKMFHGLDALRHLNLNRNQIAHMDDNAFDRLHKLRYLSMSSNKLNSLKEHHFNGLRNLYELNLHHNHIRDIHSNAFDALSNLHLCILSSNDIHRLDSLVFKRLANLKQLDLGDNKVKTITLRQLGLLNNRIINIKVVS